MNDTPKSLRLRIGLFGKTNSGKSSFINMLTGQNISIVSDIPGTTTDIVEKNMELLPIGPVTLIDTAGYDDTSSLGKQRIEKTNNILTTCNIALIFTEAFKWTKDDENFFSLCNKNKIPFIVIHNKIDNIDLTNSNFEKEKKNFLLMFKDALNISVKNALTDSKIRNDYIFSLKKLLIEKCPSDFFTPKTILQDLLNTKKPFPIVLLVTPIDSQAPKGRLILPQVQTIRDALDGNASVIVLQPKNFLPMLKQLSSPPDLIICDSQVAKEVCEQCPENIPCTTFSILFSRFKGDIVEMAKGAAILNSLNDGDKIIIAEACTHHAMEDDIGKVKIPNWIKKNNPNKNLIIEHCSGLDFPINISDYKLIIHCGGCTLNRQTMLWRIEQAKNNSVAITNYGIAISTLQGVIEKTLSPFTEALNIYNSFLRK